MSDAAIATLTIAVLFVATIAFFVWFVFLNRKDFADSDAKPAPTKYKPTRPRQCLIVQLKDEQELIKYNQPKEFSHFSHVINQDGSLSIIWVNPHNSVNVDSFAAGTWVSVTSRPLLEESTTGESA